MAKWLARSYRTFESLFLKSWWVVLFMLCCYFLYEQGLMKREHDFTKLQTQYQELLKQRDLALAEQETLTVQINSQSDPEYVELTLMKVLGLTPEGSTKVLFTNQE